jgi:hypothetical protein
MSKKKKIIIEEYFVDKKGQETVDLKSKIKLKTEGSGINLSRKFTLKNHGEGWTNPKEKRASIEIYDSINELGAPEIIIKTSSGSTYEMTLLELANIRDIANHFNDFGHNILTKTRVINEKK